MEKSINVFVFYKFRYFLVAVSDNTNTFDSELLAWRIRPSMMGSHSLYVTAWCSAIAIFLASWYSLSSSQWGFRWASSRARRLCSLSCRIWKTVSWGFWFTRTSPANGHALDDCILSRYLLSVSRLLQTNIIAVFLYVFFWVFPRRPIVVCRRFGTLYHFHLQGLDIKYTSYFTSSPWRWNW